MNTPEQIEDDLFKPAPKLKNQVYIGEEKSKAITQKDLSLKRLDESFNKHI